MSNILLLGHPHLRRVSKEVKDFFCSQFAKEKEELADTLEEFRRNMGFGRAIAAPQIGAAKRVIACSLGEGTFFIINPVITRRSEETFTLWDDCMSFPDLMVLVRRYSSVSIYYNDEKGVKHSWENLDPSVSELLQHEIDHLDGVLAVDRAVDRDSIVYRPVFEEMKQFFIERTE